MGTPDPSPRRFPEPWTIHGNDDAFWVEDADGARFGYTYFRDTQIAGTGPIYLTRDEARRIVSNIAKLPKLLRKGHES